VTPFDARTPSIARVYDYLLGGKDNYAADREAGDRVIAVFPDVVKAARENKQFLGRAVTWVANQGIGQFVDLGCGMPTAPSTYETAQAVQPRARVAYADNDAVVLSHLRALVAKGNEGVSVVEGDVGDPDAILEAISADLDLSVPTCLIMGLLLHFYDPAVAGSLVARYRGALAPGSYLVISMAHGNGEEGERWFSTYSTGPAQARNYSVAEITTLFEGTELVPPGVVDARQWHPGWGDLPDLPPRAGQTICGVGRTT
jgi:O-methyltransferase involved in polyketide biosynthesis